MADCSIEVYINAHRMICSDREGEIRLQTRQVVQDKELSLRLDSWDGKTKIRQISAESVEI